MSAPPEPSLPLTAEVQRAWNAAAPQMPQVDPFCCRSEWQLAFRDVFVPHLELLFAGDEHSCMVFGRTRLRDHVLLVPLESSWQFGCPLLGPHALDVLRDWLHAQPGRRTTQLLISAVAADGPLAKALHRHFGATHHITLIAGEIACSADLRDGLDGYLSRRSSGTRRKVHAAARRAADHGVCYERVAPADAEVAEHTYQRMLAIERRSWKGLGRCGMATPPSLQFYAALLQRMTDSITARVMFARHADRDIGFVFGGIADGIYRGQQFSYDEQWAPFSIGNLLQLEQLRWLGEENAQRYDMGPMMDYKRHWTEHYTSSHSWLLQPA